MNKMTRRLKPQETPDFEMRLEWMRELHPEYLLELYEEGTLQQTIIREVERANDYYLVLIKKGIDEYTATELKTALLAPADELGERDVPEIPSKLWNKIYKEMTS